MSLSPRPHLAPPIKIRCTLRTRRGTYRNKDIFQRHRSKVAGALGDRFSSFLSLDLSFIIHLSSRLYTRVSVVVNRSRGFRHNTQRAETRRCLFAAAICVDLSGYILIGDLTLAVEFIGRFWVFYFRDMEFFVHTDGRCRKFIIEFQQCARVLLALL